MGSTPDWVVLNGPQSSASKFDDLLHQLRNAPRIYLPWDLADSTAAPIDPPVLEEHDPKIVGFQNPLPAWALLLYYVRWSTRKEPSQWPVVPAIGLQSSLEGLTPSPYVLCNVRDIAMLVSHLGMTWTSFNPKGGTMEADGNGQRITSKVELGFVVLSYSGHPCDKRSTSEMYIRSRQADMMEFGILPPFDGLGIPLHKIGTIDEVLQTMDCFDRIFNRHEGSKKLLDNRGYFPTSTLGFDLIPLAAPMMRHRESTIIQLPRPTEDCDVLMCRTQGFRVFYKRLTIYVTEHPGSFGAKLVKEQYESLKEYVEWESEGTANNANGNNRNPEFLDRVHTCWEGATEYFINLRKRDQLQYYELMVSHLTHAVHCRHRAINRVYERAAENTYDSDDNIAETAHMYWDFVPEIVKDMQTKGVSDECVVFDAWIMMMFRAFCWWKCHYLSNDDSAMRIPSSHWDSGLEVLVN